MLCSKATGLPLFEPTLYALTELRARNRASATLQQALRSIMVLYLALERLGVDLDDRLRDLKLLEPGEIDEIIRFCRLPLSALAPEEKLTALIAPKVMSLEKIRMGSTPGPCEEVSQDTAAIRLHYARGYLKWRLDNQLLKLSGTRNREAQAALSATGELALRTLENRSPALHSHQNVGQRQGLAKEALMRLRQVIDPNSDENPWKGRYARDRNRLIIRWLLDLGLRRGELLGVRIENIDFQSHEVRIDRRADDILDPRKDQPNTKTAGRLLPLSAELTQLTHRYITEHRRGIPGARKHSFLFVAAHTGAPLALSSMTKIYDVLRQKCPDLPDDLTAHVMRHTCNDEFSDLMDEQGVSEQEEKRLRSRLMGWSETSGTAAIYTRRHVQRKARQASLDLQKKLNRKGSYGS